MSRKRRRSDTEKLPSSNPTIADLFKFVEDGNLEEFRSHCDTFGLRNHRRSDGETYLHRAVSVCTRENYSQLAAMVNHILTEAPRLTKKVNKDGETALGAACKKADCLEVIQRLVECDPDSVNVTDNCGMTPLHHFLSNIQFRPCLRTYVETKSEYRRRIAEHAQFESNCVKLVEFLAKKCKDLNIVDTRGRNVLFCTILKGDSFLCENFSNEAAIILLQNGGQLKASQRTHVFSFVTNFSPELLEAIVKYQPALLKELDFQGYSLLHRIFLYQDLEHRHEICKLLIENDAIIEKGVDAIEIAWKKRFNFEVIELLLKQEPNFDVNTLDDGGSTLLIRYGKTLEIVNKLLTLGADPNIVNKKGVSVVDNAINCKDIELLRKLLEIGVDPLKASRLYRHRTKFIEFSLYRFIITKLHSEDCKEWFDLLTYVLHVPQIKNAKMDEHLINFYMKLIKDLYIMCAIHNYSSDIAKKSLQIIINSNPLVPKMQIKSKINDIKVVMEPISELINFQNEIFLVSLKNLLEFIEMMLDVGFSVNCNHENCVTPLTMLFVYKKFIFSRFQLRRLAKLFIDKGVHVGSMVLSRHTKFFSYWKPYQLRNKNELYLPDALLLAFRHDKEDSVKLMLPYWWAPPLTLLLFPYCGASDWESELHVPKIRTISFLKKWLPKLLASSRVPPTSSVLEMKKVDFNIEFLYERALSADYIATEELLDAWFEEYKRFKRQPPSLQDLCKSRVLQLLAETASHPGSMNLPQLFEQQLPYELPD